MGNNNESIIFDGDEEDVSYCDSCDARLFERRDGSMVCSNPDCGREYLNLPSSVNKHHRELQPIESPYDTHGPEVVPMTEYATPQRKKQSILDKEDSLWVSKGSGRSIINAEDYWPKADTDR